MKTNTHLAAKSILLATALLLPSCNYKYDTVSFGAVGKAPVAKTPVPKIEIDTNISVGTLLGGSVKSTKPYDILAYYMDSSRVASPKTTAPRSPSQSSRNMTLRGMKEPNRGRIL